MYKKLLVVSLFVAAMFCWLNAEQKVINRSYNVDDFEFITTTDGTQIKYNGTQNFVYSSVPGAPNLPCHTIMVAVPDGASFDDVSVVIGLTTLFDNISIAPAQHELSYTNPDSIVYALPDPEYYTLTNFPVDNCIFASMQCMRDYRYFCFILSPFIYHPQTNQLQIASSMTLSINYSLTDYRSSPRWDDGSFGDLLRSIVENPIDVLTQTIRPPHTSDIRYLIITSNELAGSYQPLADWKTQKGVRTQIVTLESIQINPLFSGSFPEEKIKCCIQYYYENHYTQWVLLAGNDSIIPSRICFQDVPGEDHISGFHVPTDLYYACFDNNFQWDQNSNGIYGEVEDNIDLSPEIHIGRVSLEGSDVNAYVAKTIAYEQEPPMNDFALKALMIGARIDRNITYGYYQGLSHTEWQMESAWTNYIAPYWNGVRHKFYDSTNNDYGQFTVNNLELAINTGYNLIFENTHGDWDKWDFLYVPSSGGDFTTSNVTNLTNSTKQGLLYSMACFTNRFISASLGSSFIKKAGGGGVAYIGNTGFGRTLGIHDVHNNWILDAIDNSGASYDYAKRFFQYLFQTQDNSRIGSAFTASKISQIAMTNATSGSFWQSYRHVMFGLNIQGDPELSLLTENPTAMAVLHSHYFFSGPNSSDYPIDIEVGIPNALVCVSNGADVYTYGYTNQNGSISFSIDTQSTASLTVTVTAKNKLPYISQIQVNPIRFHGTVALNTIPNDITLSRIRLYNSSTNLIVAESSPKSNGDFVIGASQGQYYLEYELFNPSHNKFYYPVSCSVNIDSGTDVCELPLVTLTKYNIYEPRISTSTTLPYFKTIGQALLRVQSAVNTSYNGEAIVIKILPSVYYESLDLSPLANGQISSLTLKGWGEGAVINAQNTNSCIRIVGNGIGNIVIENLTISNGWSGIQVNLQNCDRLTVVDCEITSCASSVHCGVGIGSNVPTTVSSCTITENHGYDSGQGDDTIGGGLYIFNNTDAPTIVSDCSISNNSANVASAIYMGGSGHFNIRRNRICYNSQGQDTQRYYIAGTVGSAVIENNLFMDGNYSNCIKVQNSGSTTDVVSIQNNTFDWFEACISINSDSSVNIDNNVFKQSTIGISSDSSNNDIQVRNNAFNTTIPFDGITYDPLVHTGCVFTEELNLDNNYIPIWNLEVKSICIDNGNPDTNGDGETWLTDHNDRDSDGTQKDIGAIPLIDGHLHKYHNLTNDKVRYISIPGVANYQNSLYYVFHEFRDNGLFDTFNPVLEQITWMYNTDNSYASPSVIPEHFVCSQNGYKVTLTENAPDMLIQYQGYYPGSQLNQGMFIQDLDRYTIEHFITPPEPGAAGCQQDSNTNVWFREIYLGYYLQESLKPFDALLPILDNITTIMAEDWAMARIPIYGYNPSPGDEPADAYTNTWLGCFPTGGREITINPGEMVVVRYIGNEPIEFPLGGDNPDPPFTDPYYREMASHFGYEEKPDYIPIFLSIDLNQFEDGNKPTEIAVFVNEECKGAAVIKEDQVQLNAYITNVEDPSEELANLEFAMYFPNKAANANVLDYAVLNNQSGIYESRNVTVSECKEFLQVRIGKTEEPPLPTVTQLFGNYPNPFNPETTISFDLAEQSNVIIEVFNIKGQKVKTLVRDSYTPGHHSVVWSGTDNHGKSVSSGVYFYKLSTPSQSTTRKMLLLK